MHKISDSEFLSLERDSNGNIKDIYYWYIFITEKQKKLLSIYDKKLLVEIEMHPGCIGIQFALGL